MRVSRSLAILVMLGASALVSVPAVQADTDAATAKNYAYPFAFDDGTGDQAAPCTLGAGPGAANPENDIQKLEVTDDSFTLVMRITMGSITFTAPGTVTLNVDLTGPSGEDWGVTVVYDNQGNIVDVADYDPTTGDSDALLPGARAELDTAAKQVYIFANNADTNLAVGAEITFDQVDTGRGVGTAGTGFSCTGLDLADGVGGTTYKMARNAAPLPTGTELLGLTAAAASITKAPGQEAVFDLTVTNAGTVDSSFNLTASGLPQGYTATFVPASGAIAKNATSTSKLTVKIPTTAGPGNVPFKAKVTGSGGTNATKDLTVVVTGPNTGGTGSGTGTKSGSGTNGGGGGSNNGGGGGDDGGGDGEGGDGSSDTAASPGFELFLNFAAVGAVLVAMRRRLPK